MESQDEPSAPQDQVLQVVDVRLAEGVPRLHDSGRLDSEHRQREDAHEGGDAVCDIAVHVAEDLAGGLSAGGDEVDAADEEGEGEEDVCFREAAGEEGQDGDVELCAGEAVEGLFV